MGDPRRSDRVAFLGLVSGEEHPEHGHDEEGHDEDEEEHEEDEEDDHEHEHGSLDPHFWFDPLRVQSAVNVVAAPTLDTGPGRRGLLFKQRGILHP